VQLSHHTAAEWWSLIKRSVAAWSDDYAPSMGAALSYYSVFSMGPLLLLVISIAGLVFGEEAARGELFATLADLMGQEAADTLQQMLASLSEPSTGATAMLISVGALFIGATTVFNELQNALDRIWRAPQRKQSGIWALVRARLLSFGMILGVAFLLMVSLVASAAVSALGKWWGGLFGQWEVLLQVVNAAVGFLITIAGFALIYKLMPRVKVQWDDVLWGAVITALLFTVGKSLIGLYIGKTGVASGFGAAGSIAVIFVWIYYSAQIFLLGAEFTWVYAQTFGSKRQAAASAQTQQAQAAFPAVPMSPVPMSPVPMSPVPKAPVPKAPMPTAPVRVRSVAVAIRQRPGQDAVAKVVGLGLGTLAALALQHWLRGRFARR
jgi:membrane protein